MRLISAKEYQKIKGYKSISTVYEQIKGGKLKAVPHTKTVMRIPFDDEKGEAVNSM